MVRQKFSWSVWAPLCSMFNPDSCLTGALLFQPGYFLLNMFSEVLLSSGSTIFVTQTSHVTRASCCHQLVHIECVPTFHFNYRSKLFQTAQFDTSVCNIMTQSAALLFVYISSCDLLSSGLGGRGLSVHRVWGQPAATPPLPPAQPGPQSGLCPSAQVQEPQVLLLQGQTPALYGNVKKKNYVLLKWLPAPGHVSPVLQVMCSSVC